MSPEGTVRLADDRIGGTMSDPAGPDLVHPATLVTERAAPTPHLTATVTHEGEGAVVSVAGEMDLATAPEFERQVVSLLAPPVAAVTLDLAGLEFIDSSGLRALVAIHGAATEHRVTLTLRAVPEQARSVLELTDLADRFAIDDAPGVP
jgi:anti-sigma B factor antagonist